MKKLLSALTLTTLLLGLTPATVLAAPQNAAGRTTEQIGYDISWPQCGKRLPSTLSFAIIGVNGGTAANTNPCLSSQLAWAKTATGSTAQPKVQLYANTANPGEVIDQITTWPTSNTDETGFTTNNPYGTCAGANDLACSWQYGWNRSVEANRDRFAPAAAVAGLSQVASDYIWWLDVETSNTWEVAGTTDAFNRNVADIEGMTSYYEAQGATVGLYSTAVQWGQITNNQISPTSNLNGLRNWRPSGATLSNAIANCSVPPLTSGGFIALTQYVKQSLDYNHSCI